MTRARRVVISQEVDEYITGYKHFLKHPSAPYDKCDARAIRRKVSAMRRGIKKGARYPLTLPDCTDKILGYEVNQDGTPKYPCFKQIIYEDSTSHAQWKCSVIYDASTRTSTVYRMWNCEGIYESCTKWLLLSKFVNRNTMRNNTMKKLNITKKQFNESNYFQKKYGTLKYVSESGKIYKTSKGKILKFKESGNLVKENVDAPEEDLTCPECGGTHVYSDDGYATCGDCEYSWEIKDYTKESVDVPTTLYVLMIDKDFNRDVKEISIDDKSEWNDINIDGGCFWEIDPESEEPEFFDGFGWGNDEDGYKKIIKVSDADTRDTISMEEFKELVDAMKCS